MTRLVLGILVGLLCLSAAGARAEEPSGCDKFRWSMDRERAALTAEAVPQTTSGAARVAAPAAFELALGPVETTSLPHPPERLPKPGTFAGAVTFTTAAPGTYQVVLSDAAWVDVLQGEAFRRPSAFSGATGCPGVRKVVRFDTGPSPFVVQVSGAQVNHLRMVVEPVAAE